jgi:hypothetical protein
VKKSAKPAQSSKWIKGMSLLRRNVNPAALVPLNVPKEQSPLPEPLRISNRNIQAQGYRSGANATEDIFTMPGTNTSTGL